MRRTTSLRWKVPKNLGVAPRYDTWNAQYEPWAHMRRMGKIVGTGFYIPPEWYNHFRMFPPVHHNFLQEDTLNPRNESEPTQDDTTTMSAERLRLREELSRKSKAVASEGMRYYNLFWIQKPLDAMERQYFRLKKQGISHDVAIKKVLQEFYDSLAIKQRVANIQSEEAKLSGGFITMREATTVLQVLSQIQKEQLTPHQVATLAAEKLHQALDGDIVKGVVSRSMDEPKTAKSADANTSAVSSAADASSAANAETMTSPEALDALLEAESSGSVSTSGLSVSVVPAGYDSLPKLRETATDNTGDVDWYDVGLTYDIGETPAPTPAAA